MRYFFPLITKATTAEEHYQGLFEEKERERVNKSSGIFGHSENLEEEIGMNLDYMYYDQVNKS